MADHPPRTSPAPTRAPTRACDDDVGRPRCQLAKFQVRAPIKAAKISPNPISGRLTVCATVLATAVPKTKKATKFHPAAHSTAHRGFSTPVATTVAMEFAES